jgi:hypothetical protein
MRFRHTIYGDAADDEFWPKARSKPHNTAATAVDPSKAARLL